MIWTMCLIPNFCAVMAVPHACRGGPLAVRLGTTRDHSAPRPPHGRAADTEAHLSEYAAHSLFVVRDEELQLAASCSFAAARGRADGERRLLQRPIARAIRCARPAI